MCDPLDFDGSKLSTAVVVGTRISFSVPRFSETPTSPFVLGGLAPLNYDSFQLNELIPANVLKLASPARGRPGKLSFTYTCQQSVDEYRACSQPSTTALAQGKTRSGEHRQDM